MRKCPVCGASLKLENVERHFASVHPGKQPPRALSDEARASLQVRRATASRPLTLKRSTFAVIGVVVVLILLLGLMATYLPRNTMTPMHIHPQLTITINGSEQQVPAEIGIIPALWRDHSLDANGMDGMSPLHTHVVGGLIHVESRITRDYTVGELFRVWGQSFDATQVLGHSAGAGHRVRMIVDGTEMAPSDGVVFQDGMNIHIICDTG